MSPTILRLAGLRYFFFSNEEPRAHVHVEHSDGEAKFWLEPAVELAVNHGLKAKQLGDALAVVEANHQTFLEKWRTHFGNR